MMENNQELYLSAIHKMVSDNNKLLQEIVDFIRYLQSDAYTQKDHTNQFALNVLADLFVETLQNDKE